VKNIDHNPKVSLNFKADSEVGDVVGDVVVLTGEASLDKHPSTHDSRYLEKYRGEIPKIDLTPESFAKSYSVQIRIIPRKLRGM
jgi:PPOX class probable F420-dependent enzyme